MFIHVHKLSTLHPSRHFLSPPGTIVCLTHIPLKPQTLLYLMKVPARREPVSHTHSHTSASPVLCQLCGSHVYREPIRNSAFPWLAFPTFFLTSSVNILFFTIPVRVMHWNVTKSVLECIINNSIENKMKKSFFRMKQFHNLWAFYCTLKFVHILVSFLKNSHISAHTNVQINYDCYHYVYLSSLFLFKVLLYRCISKDCATLIVSVG